MEKRFKLASEQRTENGLMERMSVANCNILGTTVHSVITRVTLQLHDVTGKYELPH